MTWPAACRPRLLFVAACCLLVAACSALPFEEPPPDDSTMVSVLVDLHLATARADITGEPASTLRDSVLARHGLSAEAYERAMAYYVDHSAEYLKLYDRVLDRLNAERNALPEVP